MYEWIRTDNDFANAQIRNKLVDDPVLAALIDYLAHKGVINTTEFAAEVNKRCQALVSSQESVFREKR